MRCSCYIEKGIRREIPPLYHLARLLDFPSEVQELVNRWFLNQGRSLLITGLVGTGKTHLAAAITRYLHEQNRPAIFRRAATLYASLRDSYCANKSEADVLREYLRTTYLVLDDLGAGNSGDHERRCTLEVLDQRGNHLRLTVVTTNWTLEQIGECMDDRIASRLAVYKIIELT